jgi:ubiquinone/menaquinone biosynthesis C-methylase UbiE
MANVLFQSQKKEEIISEAVRVVKPGGRVVIIEWFPDSYFMTDRGWRVDPEKLKKILEKNGLILDKEFQPDDYHYGLVYRKME